jgi:hypothetical protein
MHAIRQQLQAAGTNLVWVLPRLALEWDVPVERLRALVKK